MDLTGSVFSLVAGVIFVALGVIRFITTLGFLIKGRSVLRYPRKFVFYFREKPVSFVVAIIVNLILSLFLLFVAFLFLFM